MNPEKCYISIPITGFDVEKQREKAELLKQDFEEIGYDVITPFDVCPEKDKPLSYYMGKDITALLDCDAIYLADGWKQSKGCQLEYYTAKIYGKKMLRKVLDKIELDEYQDKAMATCMDSCNNIAYMLTGLTAEVGEVNDKIAKAIRKGYISITKNNLCMWDDKTSNDFKKTVIAELGDVLWFCAGLARVLGVNLNEVGLRNLLKLASRAQRGVIDGNGDNR